MNRILQRFGNVRIFRPSVETHDIIRESAKEHLCLQFLPGNYTGAPANLALQRLYGFYEEQLNTFIERIASRSAAEFLLFQYDEASKILHGRGISDQAERDHWLSIEGNFKRAIKHIVELACVREQRDNPATSNKIESLFLMEGAIVCAEAMAALSELSERSHSIFPGEYKITILPPQTQGIIETQMVGEHSGFDIRMLERLKRDRESREKFLGKLQFDVDPEIQSKYLDSAFLESHGAKYKSFISLLYKLIDEAKPARGGFPTLFLHRENTLEALRPSGLPRKTISVILDGFTVDPEKMTKEARKLWNPKQDNRALLRGFFLFPHATGSHLAFSREMARENYIQLSNRVCYKRLPPEWTTPLITASLNELSLASGKWFEGAVAQNLSDENLIGKNYRRKVGRGQFEINIPDEVGEIDFLGYDSKSRFIIIVEAKMSLTGIEARFWRDDLDMFVHKKRSYAAQFRKKIAWVIKESDKIQKALEYSEVRGVAAAMVTLYPCIAQEYIPDFPCVSLTELKLDFQKKQEWPYELGTVIRDNPKFIP